MGLHRIRNEVIKRITLTLYNLNYGTNYATQVNENVIENVIEISEEKIKKLMPEYSKKKLAKACEILKMISENRKFLLMN